MQQANNMFTWDPLMDRRLSSMSNPGRRSSLFSADPILGNFDDIGDNDNTQGIDPFTAAMMDPARFAALDYSQLRRGSIFGAGIPVNNGMQNGIQCGMQNGIQSTGLSSNCFMGNSGNMAYSNSLPGDVGAMRNNSMLGSMRSSLLGNTRSSFVGNMRNSFIGSMRSSLALGSLTPNTERVLLNEANFSGFSSGHVSDTHFNMNVQPSPVTLDHKHPLQQNEGGLYNIETRVKNAPEKIVSGNSFSATTPSTPMSASDRSLVTASTPGTAATQESNFRSNPRKDDEDGEDDEGDDEATDCLNRFKPFHEEKWTLRYKELVQFHAQNGHAAVPHTYPPNPQLARWVKRQRRQYKLRNEGRASTMTTERLEMLASVGFIWDSHDVNWKEKLHSLLQYRQEHGHCNVPSNFQDKKLATWVKCQRRQFKLYWDGKPSAMNSDRIQDLEEAGFEWEVRSGGTMRKGKQGSRCTQQQSQHPQTQCTSAVSGSANVGMMTALQMEEPSLYVPSI